MDSRSDGKRNRLLIEVEPAIRRAFASRAALAGKSPSELFAELVESLFPQELERARAVGADPVLRRAVAV